jgi:type IV pilus assembly protein PilA
MLKTLKKRLKNQRGLTLVELLAVIVILGIISAIAVPSIGNIIEKSKEDAAISDALQIINAAKLAGAADVPAPWTNTNLGEYLTKSGDNSFSVTINNGKYSITGHEAAAKALGTTSDADATARVITEAELVTAAK